MCPFQSVAADCRPDNDNFTSKVVLLAKFVY